jgi:hypothetical protein
MGRRSFSGLPRTGLDALYRRGRPVYSFQSVISFCKGLATVTPGGGGAGREGFWHPAIRPASVAVAKIIPTAFTHTRIPQCSRAWSRPTMIFNARSVLHRV